MRYLLARSVIVVLLVQSAVAQMGKGQKNEESGSTEAQVKKMADEGREAALKGDASFLEKNTTRDYEFITGTGSVLTRSEAIETRKSGDIKYSSIEASDTKVRVHGNAAIYTATVNVKGTFKSNDISGTYRLAQMWVKEGGSWKVANTQSTKVEGP
ncbi:MAG: nuclear transport factor 2 family protein [Acidobacteria bacterium]|nr:nuclear transport factor 2 family protein [Acidobacteriota bacterium]